MPAEIEEFKPKFTPEQAGGDFYEEAKVKAVRPEQPFRPDFTRNEHADRTAEIIKFPSKKSEAEVHHEAGIPLPEEIKSEAEKAKALELLIAKGIRSDQMGSDAFDANQKLEQMLDAA